MAESIDKLPGLHALRMVAALTVFVLHSVTIIFGFQSFVLDFGLAVQLFYLVSAFALMHSTRIYAYRPDWIKDFYLKRFWRIAPLFYAVAIVTTTYLWFRKGTAPALTEIAINATFLFNFFPQYAPSLVAAGWSVGVEALFYLVFPWVFLHIRSLKSATILAAASIVVAQVARIYLEKIPAPMMGTIADISIATNAPYFCMGIVAYLAYERLRRTSVSNPGAAVGTALRSHATYALSIAALITAIVHFDPWLKAHGRADMLAWGLVFMILATWATVRPLALFNWTPVQFLGERSYSLYLLHVLVVFAMRPASIWVFQSCQPHLGDWAMVPALMTVFVALVLASTASYALIERPGMDFGRWLGKRRRQRDAVALQVST